MGFFDKLKSGIENLRARLNKSSDTDETIINSPLDTGIKEPKKKIEMYNRAMIPAFAKDGGEEAFVDIDKSSTSNQLPPILTKKEPSQTEKDLDALLTEIGAPDPRRRTPPPPPNEHPIPASALPKPEIESNTPKFQPPKVQIVGKDELPPPPEMNPSTSIQPRAIPEDQRKITSERDETMTNLMQSYNQRNIENRKADALALLEKAQTPQQALNIPPADRDLIKEAGKALVGKSSNDDKAAQPDIKEQAKDHPSKGNDPHHPVVGKHTQDLANKEASNKNVGVGGPGG